MKRYSLLSFFICLLAATSSAQDTQYATVKAGDFEKLILTKDRFVNVPEQVRKFHAKGAINVMLHIDAAGKIEKLHMMSGFNHIEFMRIYIESEVGSWTFKPLKRNGKSVSYRSVVSIPFCYGTFPKKRWC